VVLTKAIYNSSGLFIELTFDRAINSSGLNGSQIRVDDQLQGHWYLATGTVIVLSPTSLRIFLTLGGSTSGPADLLNVSAGNGIVAVNDGGAWAGVTNLAMPFP
jgi:hypothetical protein